MSNAVYTETKYLQDGYRSRKADGLYKYLSYH